jgi:hypothetical protein
MAERRQARNCLGFISGLDPGFLRIVSYLSPHLIRVCSAFPPLLILLILPANGRIVGALALAGNRVW